MGNNWYRVPKLFLRTVVKKSPIMKYLTTLTFVLLFAVSGMAQEFIKEWQGYANVEFSRGIAGYPKPPFIATNR